MGIITVSADQVRAAVNMSEAIDAVAAALVDVADDAFELPIRTAMKNGGFLVMPIHHRPSATAAVKTLSLAFDRVPAIAGTVAWVDHTSEDSIIADAGTITALRTGAIAGLATKLLAGDDAHRMAMIGAGGQSADQIRAVAAVRNIDELNIFDLNPAKAIDLAARMGPELTNCHVVVSNTAAEAVSDVDIVSCATTSRDPVLAATMLPEQVHINAIGAFRPNMRELPDLVLRKAKIYVEDSAAVLEESGEVLHAIDAGAITAADLTELHEIIRNPSSAVSRNPGWTVFKTVGIAAQDWAITRLLAEKFN